MFLDCINRDFKAEQAHPFKIKYKGYTVTQQDGTLIITDSSRRIVFQSNMNEPLTEKEMQAAVENNVLN